MDVWGYKVKVAEFKCGIYQAGLFWSLCLGAV